MKIRTSIAAAGAAVLLGGTTALALPAMASTHSAMHTLKFTSVTAKSVSFTQTTEIPQDTDLNSAGKTIGFDDVYLTFTGRTAGKGNVAVAVKGGFLYGTLTVNFKTGAISNGKVTGGTGAFKGASGTITAKNLNAKGTRTAVTVKYHV